MVQACFGKNEPNPLTPLCTALHAKVRQQQVRQY
jgi:hypothetical protein